MYMKTEYNRCCCEEGWTSGSAACNIVEKSCKNCNNTAP